LDQESILKPEIHLTNNAVQSKFEDYGKHESGNQLSFEQFQQVVDQDNGPQNFVTKKMIPDMKKQITISMESVRSQITLGKAYFVLLGYDFLIDSDYNTWLIEVNTNPCLEESSPLLGVLLPRMINDALRLTVDQVFFPRKGQQLYEKGSICVFDVPGIPI